MKRKYSANQKKQGFSIVCDECLKKVFDSTLSYEDYIFYKKEGGYVCIKCYHK